MEAMPDEIQLISAEAEQEKQKKQTISDLFTERNLTVHQVEREEQKDRDAAVDIRPVVQSDFNGGIDQVAAEHIKDGKIRVPFVREAETSGGCGGQR